ncbi:MAG: alpha-glucan family phosphorylase [Gammaproteobacteria bacterium]|nr:alpha-glucan family phosphorylase [Gammaproteobacteria bacterium]
MKSSHYLPRSLPKTLEGLAALALDLRWSWHHGSDALWRQVSPDLWEATHNPWLILETVSNQRLDELAGDKEFLAQLQEQLDSRDAHFAEASWFMQNADGGFEGYIAYFSMEFGICESLPIYSGGLGVLAGDTLKTACDLMVPMIGVGLLYQQGYFRQAIDADGDQLEFFPYNDPTMLPIVPLRDENGEWVKIALELPGRTLYIRTWQGQVGRRRLFLLDSNDWLNEPGDRAITSELYSGGAEMRLQQELVLGIGGWRLLTALGIDCPVCHLNEGHAAFAILERAGQFMTTHGCTFEAALTATRAGNLFTTHTPVAAGFDRFPVDLCGRYLLPTAKALGVGIDDLMALGRSDPGDSDEPFNMAYLAIRGSAGVNGVSRLHGQVSRDIFRGLFPRWPEAEVPVGYVTNGVHVPSWDSAAADELWTSACGQGRWRGTLETIETDLRCVSDADLWRFRCTARRQLVDYLRLRQVRQCRRRGEVPDCMERAGEIFDPDALTLGFARRFAEYKRPNLLLRDQERLARLLSNHSRPVQLVIAGKAHPRDDEGKGMIRQWQRFLSDYQLHDRAIFVEDYNLGLAARMVQGVDVWINTPRRPWEASGTSGMKVGVNGGLNLSELDGWWAEAYTPEVGWAIGGTVSHEDVAACDAADAEQLFLLLEDEVVRCFYERDEYGLPVGWISRMRESMAHLTAQYSSNRMLREYTERFYLPQAKGFAERSADRALVEGICGWRSLLKQHWQWLRFGNVAVGTDERGHHFKVQIYLDEIPVEAVRVELYADAVVDESPVRIELIRGEGLAGAANAFVFHGTAPGERPASDYTPRVVPYHPKVCVPLELNLILWYQ